MNVVFMMYNSIKYKNTISDSCARVSRRIHDVQCTVMTIENTISDSCARVSRRIHDVQ